MPSRFFTIQFRLVLGFALVLGLALFAVSWYVGSVAQSEVERFERRDQQIRAERVQRLLARHYFRNRGWDNLQRTVEQAASTTGRRIIVEDAHGAVVADSHPDSGEASTGDAARSQTIPIERNGRLLGQVTLVPGESTGTIREPAISRLASGVNRALLLTGLAAGLVGVLLVWLMSRRVLSPVRTLGAAAQKLGQGDLAQRVPTSVPGELGQLAHTFNIMASNLQEAEKRRRNLVADVAHELRTPLSNIQGYLEAVKDGLLQPNSATIDIIHQQVLHLVSLVEDLRVLALAESGSLRLDYQSVAPRELLEQTAEAFRARAGTKGVELVLDLPRQLPRVEMDRTRMTQVVGNLLENAILHSPEGSVVTISARAPDTETLRLSVADQGRGIDPEVLPQIFDRFYRVDPSRARATGGSGLGLTIAKQLVEAHQGTIGVESKVGKGSCFYVELPLSSRLNGAAARADNSL